MVLETGLHPARSRTVVPARAGTTIEGLHELEKGKLRGTLISAVARRLGDQELGQGEREESAEMAVVSAGNVET